MIYINKKLEKIKIEFNKVPREERLKKFREWFEDENKGFDKEDYKYDIEALDAIRGRSL